MTLDEAIKHCEEEAEQFEKTEKYRIIHTECGAGRYVEEHRQLAEWLEELKDYRERTVTTESASEKEKLKAEVNGYFYGLNAAGKIDWLTYNTLYNVCMSILEKYYDRMEKERRTESKKITLTEFMDKRYKNREDQDNMFVVGVSDAEFRAFIIDYLLGEDWYVVDPLGQTQINEIALYEILEKHSKRYKKECRGRK